MNAINCENDTAQVGLTNQKVLGNNSFNHSILQLNNSSNSKIDGQPKTDPQNPANTAGVATVISRMTKWNMKAHLGWRLNHCCRAMWAETIKHIFLVICHLQNLSLRKLPILFCKHKTFKKKNVEGCFVFSRLGWEMGHSNSNLCKPLENLRVSNNLKQKKRVSFPSTPLCVQHVFLVRNYICFSRFGEGLQLLRQTILSPKWRASQWDPWDPITLRPKRFWASRIPPGHAWGQKRIDNSWGILQHFECGSLLKARHYIHRPLWSGESTIYFEFHQSAAPTALVSFLASLVASDKKSPKTEQNKEHQWLTWLNANLISWGDATKHGEPLQATLAAIWHPINGCTPFRKGKSHATNSSDLESILEWEGLVRTILLTPSFASVYFLFLSTSPQSEVATLHHNYAKCINLLRLTVFPKQFLCTLLKPFQRIDGSSRDPAKPRKDAKGVEARVWSSLPQHHPNY